MIKETQPEFDSNSRYKDLCSSHLLVSLKEGQEQEPVSDRPRMHKLAIFSERAPPLDEILADTLRALRACGAANGNGSTHSSTSSSYVRWATTAPATLRRATSSSTTSRIRVPPNQAATWVVLRPLLRHTVVLWLLLLVRRSRRGITMDEGTGVPIASSLQPVPADPASAGG